MDLMIFATVCMYHSQAVSNTIMPSNFHSFPMKSRPKSDSQKPLLHPSKTWDISTELESKLFSSWRTTSKEIFLMELMRLNLIQHLERPKSSSLPTTMSTNLQNLEIWSNYMTIATIYQRLLSLHISIARIDLWGLSVPAITKKMKSLKLFMKTTKSQALESITSLVNLYSIWCVSLTRWPP